MQVIGAGIKLTVNVLLIADLSTGPFLQCRCVSEQCDWYPFCPRVCVRTVWLVSDLSTGGVPSVLECVRTVWLVSDLSTGGVRSFQECVSEQCDWCPLCPRVCVRTVWLVSALSTGVRQNSTSGVDLSTGLCQNSVTGVRSFHRQCPICPQVCVRTVWLVSGLSTDPCNAGVCQNGGTCASEPKQGTTGLLYRYTCLCPPGHMGSTCEGQSRGEGEGAVPLVWILQE